MISNKTNSNEGLFPSIINAGQQDVDQNQVSDAEASEHLETIQRPDGSLDVALTKISESLFGAFKNKDDGSDSSPRHIYYAFRGLAESYGLWALERVNGRFPREYARLNQASWDDIIDHLGSDDVHFNAVHVPKDVLGAKLRLSALLQSEYTLFNINKHSKPGSKGSGLKKRKSSEPAELPVLHPEMVNLIDLLLSAEKEARAVDVNLGRDDRDVVLAEKQRIINDIICGLSHELHGIRDRAYLYFDPKSAPAEGGRPEYCPGTGILAPKPSDPSAN